MNSDISTLGKRIKNLRNQKNMSQQALAQKSSIDATSLSRYECDKQIPNLSTLKLIACELETSLDYLVLGKDSTVKIQKAKITDEEMIFRSLSILLEKNVLLYSIDFNNEYFDISDKFISYKSFIEKFEKLKEFNELIGENYEDAKEKLILSFSHALSEEEKKYYSLPF